MFFTIDVHKVFLEIKFRICRKGNKDAFNIFFPEISIHLVLFY